MAIPLVWMVGASLAVSLMAKVEADSANRYAKRKKEESEAKYYNASRQLEKVRQDNNAKLREIHNNIVSLYQDAFQRSQPIFDFYETSLKGLPNIAIPEGYEVIENYHVPDIKITTPFLSNFDFKEVMQGVAMFGAANIAVGLLDSVSQQTTSLLKQQGMMMMSRSISDVYGDASKVRLAADKMEKEFEEFVKEVDGIKRIFSTAIAAIYPAEAQMQKHLQFFERYLEPCKALLDAGKPFNELSSDEAKKLEYLYRVLNGMKEFASNPFTVSV
jgi:hypothetical protein